MPHRHWYDDSVFIQTYHKASAGVPGFLFALGEERIFFALSPHEEFYRLLHNLFERSCDEWKNYSFVEITTEVLTFIEECQFHNFSLLLMLMDKEQRRLYACNFNMPPVQIRTVDENRIELNQVNTFPLPNDRLVIDRIDIGMIDTLLATDSWIAYHLYRQNHRHISFKKDMLMLLRHFGIPQYFNALNQMVLINRQETAVANIVHQRTLPARIATIIEFEEEFEHTIGRFFSDENRNATATFVLNELLSNAYEYGVLGLDPDVKQTAMENGNFFEWVQNIEKRFNGKIDVTIDIYKSNTLRVAIDDYGNGFEPERIDRNITDEYDYHGRGLAMVSQMIDGLFYAKNGSQVIFYLRYDTPDWDVYSPQTLKALGEIRLLCIGRHLVGGSEGLVPHIRDYFHSGSVSEGITVARDERPNFVIIEDDESGSAIGAIRQLHALLGDIPVIFVGGHFHEDLFIEAIRSGIDQIIPPYESGLKEAILKVIQYRYFKNGSDYFLFQKAEEKRDLRAQNQYYREQQIRAFEKQKLLMHNESQQIDWIGQELFYKPLEILSGDIYSIHQIDEARFCCFIVDSMGKGLSASVTSILSSAFINRAIAVSKEKGDFALSRLVNDFITFITPNLLEDEILSFAFIACDNAQRELEHIGFGMYPVLLKRPGMPIELLKSQYPPLMRGNETYRVSSQMLPERFELLFYSDGLCEMEGFAIVELIELYERAEDYAGFMRRLQEALTQQEQTDDITLLHFSHPPSD